ncbi:hypothetical protein T01_6981 [Trichinella spiralis]|uniref:Uncharacterized protein n=1 Tax=Trichinella spiralis TaxID=6334 RepID=A0A0V1ANU5_TRISP|nr:hypothetical protein T01_6981 [Trichinella spiralis]
MDTLCTHSAEIVQHYENRFTHLYEASSAKLVELFALYISQARILYKLDAVASWRRANGDD